jgi:hypothetical protein
MVLQSVEDKEYGKLVEWELSGEEKYSDETHPSITLPTTNSTWPDLKSNSGCRGWNWATNRLSGGTTIERVNSRQIVATLIRNSVTTDKSNALKLWHICSEPEKKPLLANGFETTSFLGISLEKTTEQLLLLGSRFLIIQNLDYNNWRAAFSTWSVPRCYKRDEV